jgi:sigma-B regulation protein RsbU (phosphoserine phosphatase)
MNRVPPPRFALRALEAAVRHRSCSRAAKELGLTCGALRRQVRRLEDGLGARLIERRGDAMIPTPEAVRLAGGIARSLDLLQAELAEAHSLQLALAPPPVERLAPLGRIGIEVLLEPAGQIGGDLVDHFEVGDQLQVFLLGDVSNKGAGAALMMARTVSAFRALASRPAAVELYAAPERAAGLVNDILAQRNPTCMFVTMLVASLDILTGELAFVRCGHLPPFVRRRDGTMERLEGPGGPPLGLIEGVRYLGGGARLGLGDRCLVVSDGATEAAGQDGALFGDRGVASWLEAAGEGAALSDLLATVRAYEAGSPPSDDLAALLLRVDHHAAG